MEKGIEYYEKEVRDARMKLNGCTESIRLMNAAVCPPIFSPFYLLLISSHLPSLNSIS